MKFSKNLHEDEFRLSNKTDEARLSEGKVSLGVSLESFLTPSGM